MRFLTLFSGIDGFRCALESLGHKSVGWCEIDKHAQKAYKTVYDCEGEWFSDDIRTVDPSTMPDFDILTFGWPCQDNSIAGKRAGQREGTRSGLLYEATRILRAKKARYFIAENVAGLFSVNDGRDFYETIREFTDTGYDVQWQLLNTSWFLPQNRERIYFVGHLRGTSRPEVFPIGEGTGEATETVGLKQVISGRDAERVYDADGLARTLKSEGGGQGAKTGLYFINKPKFNKAQKNNISQTLRAGADIDKQPYVMVTPVLTPDRPEKRQNGRRFKEPGEPMFTLTAQDRHGVMMQRARGNNKGGCHDIAPTLTSNSYEHNNHLYDGRAIRRLTPLECFRLQGFPDEFYYKLRDAGISDSQLYKIAGNAVSVPVVKAIAERLS